jgi:hypothetical protein
VETAKVQTSRATAGDGFINQSVTSNGRASAVMTRRFE